LNQMDVAVFALQDIPGELSTEALRFASGMKEPTLQLNAVCALLARNDISELDSAANALLAPDESPSSDARVNLVNSLSHGVKDPAAIPVLDTLLRAGDPQVRGAATSALGHTSSPKAIAIVARALDDPEVRVRYLAALALADLTGEATWRPTVDDFQEREAAYLAHRRQLTEHPRQ
jgi:HEAT repeat protein